MFANTLNSRHHSPESPAMPRPDSETKFYSDAKLDEIVWKDLEMPQRYPENLEIRAIESLVQLQRRAMESANTES